MSGLVLFVVLMAGGLVGSHAVAPKPSTCSAKAYMVMVETRTLVEGRKVWYRGFCTEADAVVYGRSLALKGWDRDTTWTAWRRHNDLP